MSETIRIERLGLLGDGIAPGPVFAPRTLPGEEITGEIADGRIDQPRIVTPSNQRIKSPCPHYARCGGCALLHASDGFVAEWKQAVVAEALRAQRLEAPFRKIATSPSASRRRATFSGRRLKKGAAVGFHTRASDTVVEVPECRVIAPELAALRGKLAAFVAILGSRKGETSFAATLSESGIDLDIRGGKDPEPEQLQELVALAYKLDLARLSLNGDVQVTLRPPVHSFGPAQVVPPPGAFLQASREGEQVLVSAVSEAVGPAKQIADLFAGCGTFALPLAQRAEVHAVEGDAAMLAALDAGWRKAQGLSLVTTEARDLFRRPLLPDELARFEAVVIDPPRAGAEAQMAEIARAQVPQVAAVSCNPVTFARDAKILSEAGYRLNWVQVVDQFRWSPHIELAASFSLAHIPA
ncbi:MAG: class I SAM-dependent RNA methyltransferase [Dinoroseobacter sp.]|nr:class I SAM-dependent RNA methyltransferase [Dinoroseobacter sp.]